MCSWYCAFHNEMKYRKTVQMYCSNVGGWLWWADATESYVQGPQTGKWCKLEVQNFCCCSVYWNMLYTQMNYIRSKFPHFPVSSNKNLQQNGVALKCIFQPRCHI